MKHLRPFTLVPVLLCFGMPWIDIRCNHGTYGHIVVTQSGLEMTYGGTKTKSERPVPEAERLRFSAFGFDQPNYLIIAFGLLTLAALATYPVVSPRGRPRKASLACGFAAAAILIFQVCLGFPLVKAARGATVNYTVWFGITLCCSCAYPLLLQKERSDLPSSWGNGVPVPLAEDKPAEPTAAVDTGGRDIPSGSKSNSTNPQLGGAVGAMIGAVGRFLVAVSFAYYHVNLVTAGTVISLPGRQPAAGGVSFSDILFSVFSGQEGSSIAFIAAGIGAVVGGIAGRTCRPILGAAIGGGLSGLCCTFFVVLPWNLAFYFSPGSEPTASSLKTAIIVGLLAMILVGAMAGGLGAAVGKRGLIKAESVARLMQKRHQSRWLMVTSIPIGLGLGFVLFGFWCWMCDPIERMQLWGFYLCAFLGFGLFAGIITMALVFWFSALRRDRI
jgi:hypothetical protein